MVEAPLTRPSLLVRLRDARDEQAWAQFVEVYAPLVYSFACRHGLQDADAADLTQDVLRSVVTAAGRFEYDAQRGSFRGWLFTVVKNKLRDFLDRRRHEWTGSGDTSMLDLLANQPAPEEDEAAVWEQEHERRLFLWAAEQVRGSFQDSTWQAFWLTAVEGQRGKDVAKQLGLSVAAVYLARRRVLTRLREQLREVEGEEADG
jgi:RNA polymerase sigma factor (sigma-70 family)